MTERAFLDAMISCAKDISREKEFFSQVNFMETLPLKKCSRFFLLILYTLVLYKQ